MSNVVTKASPEGLPIDCTFVKFACGAVYTLPLFKNLGNTETSQGEIVADVLGGITASWSLGILFILSPNLFTVFAPETIEIQL